MYKLWLANNCLHADTALRAFANVSFGRERHSALENISDPERMLPKSAETICLTLQSNCSHSQS
jgi:hypothetical protein